jgi:PhnB protein
MIADPFGHFWGFATHIEDLSVEEIRKRAEAKFGGN